MYKEHIQARHDFMKTTPQYPGGYTGKGIVICAGGKKYTRCLVSIIGQLRNSVHCNLPIEIWHLGKQEFPEEKKVFFTDRYSDIRFIDAYEVRETHPMRILNGWEVKVFSILYSSFQHVLLLDADNNVTTDPAMLFDTPEYAQTGALFWPDFGRLKKERSFWQIFELEYQDEPEFETGQICVDKQRCWKELQLTKHINEHSDFYYRHVHGDKETFHAAWRVYGTPYTMCGPRTIGKPTTMCQRFPGKTGSDVEDILFHHRNMAKWRTPAELNKDHSKFVFFEDVLKYLEDYSEAFPEDNDKTTRRPPMPRVKPTETAPPVEPNPRPAVHIDPPKKSVSTGDTVYVFFDGASPRVCMDKEYARAHLPRGRNKIFEVRIDDV